MVGIKRLAAKARLSMKRLLKRRQHKASTSTDVSTPVDSEVHETPLEHCEHSRSNLCSGDDVCLTRELNDCGNVEDQAERPQPCNLPLIKSSGDAAPSQPAASDTSNINKTGVVTRENESLLEADQQAMRANAPRIICPREERSDFFLYGYKSDSASNKSITRDEEGANPVNDYNFGGPSHYYGVCTLFRDDPLFAETETAFEQGDGGGHRP
ncbi:hypothetical protein IWX49DRAFT_588028 [Phyllosticta citricarpa]|uniref:Uncharacterized protein n=2 Tax=Phyllosticta TaxID=121621 RepID=A0ABR1L8V5_9PEZI